MEIAGEATPHEEAAINLASGSRENSTLIHETLDSQGEIVTFMDQEAYNAAIRGDIEYFKDEESVDLLLTPNKNTVLHIHFTAQEPQTVSEKFTEDILEMCPHLVSQGNCYNETPLHIAARYGHFGVVTILIEHAKALDADPENGNQEVQNLIRAVNHENNSALHEAVRFCHIQTVGILIDEDQNHSYSENNDGEAPLYMAAARGCRKLVSKMLTAWNAPAYDGPNGRTALHAAVLCGDREMVEHMLGIECLKASIRQVDEQGWTPLHCAARCGLHSIAELLLKKDRKTAYIRDTEGRTALHVAAIIGCDAVMKVILSHCPDCSELVDKEGCNALHCAIKSLSGGAPYFRFIGLIGDVPHCVAIKRLSGGATSVVFERPSLSNLFNQKDSKGNTALHLIADQSLFEMSDIIKHPRVDKMALNQRKHTALDIASDKVGSRDITSDTLGMAAYKTRALLEENGAKPGCGRESMRKYYGRVVGLPDWYHRSRDCNLLVVTLIATVTFAAGFTLPGGSMPDGKNAGSPILKHNRAFQAFIVFDTLALLLSSSAVFTHLALSLTNDGGSAFKYFVGFYALSMHAMIAMVLAFITGIYAVLGGFSGLGIPTLVIGISGLLATLVRTFYL